MSRKIILRYTFFTFILVLLNAIITSASTLELSTKAKSMLEKQHFVVVPKDYIYMNKVYEDCIEESFPVLITLDSVLHTSQTLFDILLEDIQKNQISEDMAQFTDAMLDYFIKHYNKNKNPDRQSDKKYLVANDQILKNIAFFTVGNKLLNPDATVPELVNNLVSRELNLIEQHADSYESPVLEYDIDYARFAPPANMQEKDQRYFKAIKWYDGICFYIHNKDLSKLQIRSLTVQGLLIVQALKEVRVKEESAISVLNRMFNSTKFLNGEERDIQADEYMNIAQNIFNKVPDVVFERKKIGKFISKAKKLRKHTIETAYGLRLLTQAFLPDTYIYKRLAFPKVGSYINPRKFPRGLDLLIMLESQEAEHMLGDTGKEKFLNYSDNLDKFTKYFKMKSIDDWQDGYFWNWIYVLRPLLVEEKVPGFVPFLYRFDWIRKQMQTFLASWTQLRHDFIQYSGIDATDEEITAFEPDETVKGWVEPYPVVYNRLIGLTRQIYSELDRAGILNDLYKDILTRLEHLLIKLEDISLKELENTMLAASDFSAINKSAIELVNISRHFGSRKTPVIHHFHTYSSFGKQTILELATGNVSAMYLTVNNDSTSFVAIGPVFSYYEIESPVSEKHTDTSWQ